ncbi:conserved hypothetical protein (plasmid) [Deferribacter desulfuricans SSM1]|uniref:Chemotaxis protein CheW n=1 Tax=Deferribacter desulfuricans (strain DSM 14783 / JCM 11476 / NBRC 101012 / SSM1) TaxID=639282 RepID=D3PF10_DEFDS|nr:chemotaxis protein CheW [Deferribacter desulfuricans]BAI81802.1 conserved hypothetical protein [Deferribacter desulfuricans SSM1]
MIADIKLPNDVEANNHLITDTSEEEIQIVGFKLGEEEYAIDILKIQEIIKMTEVTTVPRTEYFVLGVMNLRGKVIPVVDLRLRFNLDKSDFDKNTRIIIANFEKESIGFVVDELTEVMRINKNIVEPAPPLVSSIGDEYILGICKYNDRLILLLDIDYVIFKENRSESYLKKILKSDSDDFDNENKKFLGDYLNEGIHKGTEENVKNKNNKENKDNRDTDNKKLINNIESNSKENLNNDSNDLSIDELIAIELAKREKETEELLKKKKNKDD